MNEQWKWKKVHMNQNNNNYHMIKQTYSLME